MQRKFSAGEAKICLLSSIYSGCQSLMAGSVKVLQSQHLKPFFFFSEHKKQENPFQTNISNFLSALAWLSRAKKWKRGPSSALDTSFKTQSCTFRMWLHSSLQNWILNEWSLSKLRRFVSPLPPSHSRRCWSSCHACHWLPGTGHRWTWHTLQSSSECRCRSLCSTSWCTSHQPLLCCCGDTKRKKGHRSFSYSLADAVNKEADDVGPGGRVPVFKPSTTEDSSAISIWGVKVKQTHFCFFMKSAC